eukprot:725153-Pelagomonas_calceolata.AAC.2
MLMPSTVDRMALMFDIISSKGMVDHHNSSVMDGSNLDHTASAFSDIRSYQCSMVSNTDLAASWHGDCVVFDGIKH